MTGVAGTIVRKIQNTIGRLMGDDNINTTGNVKQIPIIQSRNTILHKHGYAIKPYAVNDSAGIAKIMDVWR